MIGNPQEMKHQFLAYNLQNSLTFYNHLEIKYREMRIKLIREKPWGSRG